MVRFSSYPPPNVINLWEFSLGVTSLGVPEMVISVCPFNDPVSSAERDDPVRDLSGQSPVAVEQISSDGMFHGALTVR